MPGQAHAEQDKRGPFQRPKKKPPVFMPGAKSRGKKLEENPAT
jgi:hypothetical protein